MSFANRISVKPLFAVGLGASLLCHGVTQAGPHVHGAAELMLAAEGNRVEIILNVPAMSVVGFESQVASEEQQQRVNEAAALLRNPSQLFSLRGGQCTLEDALVDFSAITDGPLHTEEEHHSDNEHAAHEHSAHEEAVADEDHSDIAVQYHFNCDNSSALEQLRFGPDGLPFKLEQISVRWVSESGQGGAEVSPTTPYVDF